MQETFREHVKLNLDVPLYLSLFSYSPIYFVYYSCSMFMIVPLGHTKCIFAYHFEMCELVSIYLVSSGSKLTQNSNKLFLLYQKPSEAIC